MCSPEQVAGYTARSHGTCAVLEVGRHCKEGFRAYTADFGKVIGRSLRSKEIDTEASTRQPAYAMDVGGVEKGKGDEV